MIARIGKRLERTTLRVTQNEIAAGKAQKKNPVLIAMEQQLVPHGYHPVLARIGEEEMVVISKFGKSLEFCWHKTPRRLKYWMNNYEGWGVAKPITLRLKRIQNSLLK